MTAFAAASLCSVKPDSFRVTSRDMIRLKVEPSDQWLPYLYRICPRATAKGYDKGKKGYSKSKGKGKGKGKWQPRFKGRGKSKGYHGYSEKTLPQSFTTSARPLTPEKPAKAVHFRMDHEDSVPVIHFKGKKDNGPESGTTVSR